MKKIIDKNGRKATVCTLVLRVYSWFQLWTAESPTETMMEPTKCGIVKVLSKALGRDPEDDMSDLYGLRLGVRIDQPGQVLEDEYLIGVNDVTGEEFKENVQYLDDARFVVGLESDDEELLKRLSDALEHPSHLIRFGDEECTANHPIVLGLRHTDLETALGEVEWMAYREMQLCNLRTSYQPFVRLIVDATGDEFNGMRKDILTPSGEYEWRHVLEKNVKVENAVEKSRSGRWGTGCDLQGDDDFQKRKDRVFRNIISED